MSASGLGKPGVAAVQWSTASSLARFALQLGAQVVLARTLGPEVFGVFAIGMVVLTFANFVSGFGFSWSLMQRATLHEDDVRFAWTWQLLVGALTTAAVYAVAPALAGYFREPRAESVIQWLALACLLTAAAAPATYLLQRDLNFRAVGLIQVGSYAAGYVAVGVPLALSGWGANALVAAWLVQAGVMLVASYAAKPHAVRPLFWYSGARHALDTGQAVFFTNVINWMLNNLDRVLIGRLLNAHSLGLYNVAYNLAALPNNLLLGALQPAFLAAGARLQDQRERLGHVFMQMLATVLVLGVPAFVFLALISADLVRLLYGPAWQEAGWVLGVLFLSMPAYVIWGLSTPVLWNTGRRLHECLLQVPLVFLGGAAFYALAGHGIRAAALVAAGLLVVRGVVLVHAALRALDLRWTPLAPEAGRGLLLAGLSTAGVWLGQVVTARHDSAALTLAASGLLALACVVVPLVLRPSLLGPSVIQMVLRFVPSAAAFFNRPKPMPVPEAMGEQRS
jgi:lipopolysaccharide exporter